MTAVTNGKSIASNTRGATKRVPPSVEDTTKPNKKAKVSTKETDQSKEVLSSELSSISDDDNNVKAAEVSKTILERPTQSDDVSVDPNTVTKASEKNVVEDLPENPFVDKSDHSKNDLPAPEPTVNEEGGSAEQARAQIATVKGNTTGDTGTKSAQTVDEHSVPKASTELEGRLLQVAVKLPLKAIPPLSLEPSDSDSHAECSSCSSPTPPEKKDTHVDKGKQSAVKNNSEFKNPGRIACISMGSNGLDRFPISNLPLSAKWGRYGSISAGQEDKSRFLTVHGIPIRATITGRVSSLFFYDSQGQPQPRVTIGISPLRVQDKISYNALINTKSNPVLSDERDIVYAARLQRQRVRDQPAAVNQPYTRVFDMQSGPTKKRNPKPASMIAKDDIVMLECHITRYKPMNGLRGKRSSKEWEAWNVALELIDIIYLYQAPDATSTDVIVVDNDEDEEY